MYKCKQSSVKLYACKAHNDIPGTHIKKSFFITDQKWLFCSKMNCLPFVTPPTMSSTEYFQTELSLRTKPAWFIPEQNRHSWTISPYVLSSFNNDILYNAYIPVVLINLYNHVLVTVIDFHDKTKMLIKMINKQYI